MQLMGPEAGLHWRSQPVPRMGQANLEVDALLGRQKYTSDSNGSVHNVPQIETRWRVLWPTKASLNISYGLALHTHSDYLEGATSTGQSGYDRQSTQIWLPVRWRDSGQNWPSLGPAKTVSLDTGLLLWGKHLSRLSQTDAATYIDTQNTQHTGIYIQTKADYATASGTYSPFIRWTWVDDSDKVNSLRSGFQDFYTPINRRIQIGVEWQYSR